MPRRAFLDGDGIVQVFRREDAPYTDAAFTLGGINPEKVYVFRDADNGSETEVGGRELVSGGFKVHIPEKRSAKIYFYFAK